MYKVNEKFFDRWSPEMSYVLGFLIADGHIKYYPISKLSFDIKDREVLVKIRRSMKSTHPIKSIIKKYKNKMFPLWRLDICNKYMINRLVKLGITERKSLTIQFPKVPKKYLNHFIRGVFDGDGGVYRHFNKVKRSKKQFSHIVVSLASSSKKFIEKLSEVVKHKFRTRYNRHYEIVLVSKMARDFLNYIYKNKKNLFMERKYNYYLNYKNICRFPNKQSV